MSVFPHFEVDMGIFSHSEVDIVSFPLGEADMAVFSYLSAAILHLHLTVFPLLLFGGFTVPLIL